MRARIIALLIPLFLLLAAPLWYPAAADFLSPPHGLAAGPAKGADIRQFALTGVRFSQSRGGRPEWQIKAARLITAGGRDDQLHLEKVVAVLHGQGKDNGKGKETAQDEEKDGSRFHITSDKGVYDSKALVLTLVNEVLVRMGNGYELRTDTLQYLEKTSMVQTSAPVSLVGKDLTVSGRGMAYNLKTGSYAVGGRLSVDLK
ncbi:MAG: LPS export ABC transporter periplasmic protein LptC [Desulfobacteraceae bacterium]|nr:LPS export ABC transporter periplasmic protein LptC [Desulfobacteraceae bacterium]